MNDQVVLIPISVDQLMQNIREAVEGVIKENREQELQARLLSAAETVKLFKPAISKVTLHNWTTQGLIPVHRIGGRLFYKYSEVINSAKKLRKYDRDKHFHI